MREAGTASHRVPATSIAAKPLLLIHGEIKKPNTSFPFSPIVRKLRICCREKTIIFVKLTASGKTAHCSTFLTYGGWEK